MGDQAIHQKRKRIDARGLYSIMETNLLLIHLVFIGACVFFSWRSGFQEGKRRLFEELTHEVVDLQRVNTAIKEKIAQKKKTES